MSNIKNFQQLEKTNFNIGIDNISEWDIANCDSKKDKIKVRNEARKARKSLKNKSRGGSGMKGLSCTVVIFILGICILLVNPFIVHIAWNILLGFAFPDLIFLGYWQRVAVGLAIWLLFGGTRSSK